MFVEVYIITTFIVQWNTDGGFIWRFFFSCGNTERVFVEQRRLLYSAFHFQFSRDLKMSSGECVTKVIEPDWFCICAGTKLVTTMKSISIQLLLHQTALKRHETLKEDRYFLQPDKVLVSPLLHLKDHFSTMSLYRRSISVPFLACK